MTHSKKATVKKGLAIFGGLYLTILATLWLATPRTALSGCNPPDAEECVMPTVSITGPVSACISDSVTFGTDISTGPGICSGYSILWSGATGSSTSLSGTTLTTSYDTPGEKTVTVTLTVEGGEGDCTTTASNTFTVIKVDLDTVCELDTSSIEYPHEAEWLPDNYTSPDVLPATILGPSPIWTVKLSPEGFGPMQLVVTVQRPSGEVVFDEGPRTGGTHTGPPLAYGYIPGDATSISASWGCASASVNLTPGGTRIQLPHFAPFSRHENSVSFLSEQLNAAISTAQGWTESVGIKLPLHVITPTFQTERWRNHGVSVGRDCCELFEDDRKFKRTRASGSLAINTDMSSFLDSVADSILAWTHVSDIIDNWLPTTLVTIPVDPPVTLNANGVKNVFKNAIKAVFPEIGTQGFGINGGVIYKAMVEEEFQYDERVGVLESIQEWAQSGHSEVTFGRDVTISLGSLKEVLNAVPEPRAKAIVLFCYNIVYIAKGGNDWGWQSLDLKEGAFFHKGWQGHAVGYDASAIPFPLQTYSSTSDSRMKYYMGYEIGFYDDDKEVRYVYLDSSNNYQTTTDENFIFPWVTISSTPVIKNIKGGILGFDPCTDYP